MKKLSLVALAAALSLTALTACSGGSDEPASEPTSAQQSETQNTDEESEMAAEWKLPKDAPDIAASKEFVLAGKTLQTGVTVREMVEALDWQFDTKREDVTIEDILALMLGPGDKDNLPMKFPGKDGMIVNIGLRNESDAEAPVAEAIVRSITVFHNVPDDLETEFAANPHRYEGFAKVGDAALSMSIDDFIARYGKPEDVGAQALTPLGTISYTYATTGSHLLNEFDFAKGSDGKFYLYSFLVRDFPDEVRQYIK
ncbi:MAG: hypothetical protein Q4E03_03295 [Trueperella sp.]|nr:hypothetical protein [Trueperella sp.]